ncbi:unnamed protein product [Rhizoctonia solani]|uniref:Jacalin-type lectin domain-containing protein n=1 Tax=Rhizoctonia solani TaxID=456999 RepID=A0A8H3E526_9AGAM|nr:unnamed protein product [Rhizoctonia solani]
MSRFDYGVIHVQEDFKLDYHCVLYEYDQHPFRTVVSSKVVSNPGLDTISKYSWIDYGRTWWNKSGSDAKKGFTFMRVRIDEGVYIDMVNLDASAGFEPRDQAARHWNIQQVTDFIDAHSYGNAVIVFGNTNSLYTSGTDNFRRFTDQNGLRDAWVQATGGISPAAGSESIKCPAGIPLNISCEVGDKVFYRESPIIKLTVSGFFYDTKRFLTPTRIPLTARYPVRVEFDYTLKPGLRQSDLYGGPHGTWFNDLPSIPPSPKLSSITLRGGNRLDGLSLTLTSGKTLTHGGWGGDPYSLTLEPGEYITSVKLCWGKKHQHTRIFYAEATTNQGNSVQAGKSTGSCEIPSSSLTLESFTRCRALYLLTCGHQI